MGRAICLTEKGIVLCDRGKDQQSSFCRSEQSTTEHFHGIIAWKSLFVQNMECGNSWTCVHCQEVTRRRAWRTHHSTQPLLHREVRKACCGSDALSCVYCDSMRYIA